MNNSYSDSTMNTPEIGIALEDFTYGGTVKISIPSLTPFMDNNKASSGNNKVIKKNIMNKDTSQLKLTDCISQNYIELPVPLELYRYKLNEPYERTATYSGSKGEKFVIMFIGGSIDKPIIVRRY